MTSICDAPVGTNPNLPKRFALLPAIDGSLKVNLATECVGYVWPEQEEWRAKDSDGALLDTGTCRSVFEAVTAVFNAHSSGIFAA